MPMKATMRVVDPAAVPTPSQAIVNSASEVKYETDKRGRKIGIVRPNPVLRYRLLKMLGGEGSKNEPLLIQALFTCLVRSIDNEEISMPNGERELEMLMGRLDDDGLNAVGKCLAEQFGVDETDENAQDQIKN